MFGSILRTRHFFYMLKPLCGGRTKVSVTHQHVGQFESLDPITRHMAKPNEEKVFQKLFLWNFDKLDPELVFASYWPCAVLP